MSKAIFHDPGLKRWRMLRRILNALGVVITLVVAAFLFTAFRQSSLDVLSLPEKKFGFKPLPRREHPRISRRGTHRRSSKPPSQVTLNEEEPLRAAYYVLWDAGSYSSLREHVHQIDLLFPEWLHVLSADGRLQAVTADNALFDVVQNGHAKPVDDKVMPLLRAEKAQTEVFPLVNNFNPGEAGTWQKGIGEFLSSQQARNRFRDDVDIFLASDNYGGISLDFEEIPTAAQPGFNALVAEMGADLHARDKKLYVNVPVSDNDFNYKFLAENSDGLVFMDYDQHQTESAAGPIAAQDWYVNQLRQAERLVPREKIIAAVGNYGYEWTRKPVQCGRFMLKVCTLSVQEAWLRSQESETEVELDPDALNPHFSFEDEAGLRHDIWYLDAVTLRNQMHAARQLGIRTFALWRLGSEDGSMWEIWDKPGAADVPAQLANVPPGYDVDIEGDGEILRIRERPQAGRRTVTLDPVSSLITAEHMDKLPSPYVVDAYGRQEKKIAITFDDGPDPTWTPKILDVLKAEHAPAAFMLIGLEAESYPGLMQRIYREGHEIGNHTLTHPDISDVSGWRMETEINVTERLFAAKLGVKPLFFRAPYSVDQEPDTADEVRPLEFVQDLHYITVGDKIDPNDWQIEPQRPSAEEIAGRVMQQLDSGNIILLHDGGGDRSATVKALPLIIRGIRERGYQIVPVAALLGKTRADVMPPLTSSSELWAARVDNIAFAMFSVVLVAVPFVFFLGDILMTGRLLLVGALATYDRLRAHESPPGSAGFGPEVAVLIPAYNEEKVIARTIRSVLRSDYHKLRVIVIDDGSKDRTLEVAQSSFSDEIKSGRLTVLTKKNSGKAEALNFALAQVAEPIYVGIDADTVIARDAIRLLVPHFADARIGAVAGNAKVGNRVNLWTRWQALEYITSQNFERRALNVLGAVTVVPGAIGAWRTGLVRAAGGYPVNTVAEDADLTMGLLRQGYKVVYEDRALAFTEAPVNANGLMRQRFRWSFGILQALWKHRGAVLRRGPLGMVALPNIVIFQILLPLLSPFIDLMFLFSTISYIVNRTIHPEATDPRGFEKIVLYFVAFLVIDFIASALAFALERRGRDRGEDYWLLAQIWLQRFTYRQLFSVVLFKTLKRAIDGRPFSWDKLERTAALSPLRGA